MLPKPSRKAQKKALKKLLNKEKTSVKKPSMSKNPAKRVAKNTVVNMRMSSVKKARQMEKILASIAAPKEYPAVRLGTSFGSYQTAVANPFRITNSGWDSGTNSTSAFLFRDPYRFFISRVTTTSPSVYQYQVQGTGQSIAVEAIGLQFGPLLNVATTTATNTVHGNALYPGRFSDSKRSWIWVEAGQPLTITNPTTATLSFFPYFLTPDGTEQITATQTVASLTPLIFNVAFSGYWSFDVNATANVAFVPLISLNIPAGTWWGHRSVPWMTANYSSCDAMKLYAGSLMFTNEASPLNRQGKIAAAQIPQGRDWRNYTSYSTVAGVKDAYVSDAENGYYGFLKPTQPHDIDFIENNSIGIGGLVFAWFDLSVPSDFMAVNVTVTTPLGQDGYYTYAAAFEYRTSDQWRDVEHPTITAETVMDSMSLVARLPQHHENPFHLSDIYDWIKNAVSDIWGGFKSALPVVADVATKTAGIAAAIAPFL